MRAKLSVSFQGVSITNIITPSLTHTNSIKQGLKVSTSLPFNISKNRKILSVNIVSISILVNRKINWLQIN